MVVSDSAGCINVLTVAPSGVQVTDEWKAHDFEAWIAAYDCHQPNIIFTGDSTEYCLWQKYLKLSEMLGASGNC